MSEFKATIKSDNLDIKFQIWQGYIQKPKWELDTFTRLGGSKIYVQKTRRLSNPSQISCAFFCETAEEGQAHINSMLFIVGDFVEVEYFGEICKRVLVEDVGYNMRAVDGKHKIMVEYQLLLRQEESDE